MPNPTKPTNSTSYEDVLAELKELLPRNYIGGLVTSNDAGDAAHDVNIAVGECRDVTDAASLRLATEITKQIDAAWAVGDDAGGLDVGSVVADQMYALWLIKRSDTGVVDAIFSILGLLEKVITVSVETADDSYNDSLGGLAIFKPGQTIYVEGFANGANNGLKTVVTSAAAKITVTENLVDEAAPVIVTMTAQVTGPTMPANYDYRRLIAFVRTDGAANIIAYTQSGDYFRYTGDVVSDVNQAIAVALTWQTGTLSAPPFSIAHIYGNLSNGTSTNPLDALLYIKTKGAADSVSSSEAFAAYNFVADNDGFQVLNAIDQVLVDSSRQVEYTAQELTGAATVQIKTLGFTMLTRREP